MMKFALVVAALAAEPTEAEQCPKYTEDKKDPAYVRPEDRPPCPSPKPEGGAKKAEEEKAKANAEAAKKAEEEKKAQAEAAKKAEEQKKAQAEAAKKAEEQKKAQAEAEKKAEEQKKAQAEAAKKAEDERLAREAAEKEAANAEEAGSDITTIATEKLAELWGTLSTLHQAIPCPTVALPAIPFPTFVFPDIYVYEILNTAMTPLFALGFLGLPIV